jgi:hypothetical protein
VNKAIEKLLSSNRPEHPRFRDQRLREVLQVLVLLGLKRAGFFEVSSFYGGTALRLLHGLDRFSEDLDFCLHQDLKSGSSFDLSHYYPVVEETLASFGFQLKIETEQKLRPTPIQSAFVKGSTYVNYLAIGEVRRSTHPEQLTKIKIEIDTENPEGGIREMALVAEPEPFMVGTLDRSSLFAGKLHAIIAREMSGRVKGRDFYDLLHFISDGTLVNLRYLRAKLIDSGHLPEAEAFSLGKFQAMLLDKLKTTNFRLAAEDVSPFLYSDQKRADLRDWNFDFFKAVTKRLQAREEKKP